MLGVMGAAAGPTALIPTLILHDIERGAARGDRLAEQVCGVLFGQWPQHLIAFGHERAWGKWPRRPRLGCDLWGQRLILIGSRGD